ncbi:MAG: hypothetical protein ACYDCL_00920 [Myxococcales bacterium]
MTGQLPRRIALCAFSFAFAGCNGLPAPTPQAPAHSQARLSLTSEEQLQPLPCPKYYCCNGGICGYFCCSGPAPTFASNPAVASWGPGNLDVVVVGSDKNLYFTQETSGVWQFGLEGAWSNAGSYSGHGFTGDPSLTAYIMTPATTGWTWPSRTRTPATLITAGRTS